ncbi:MAG: MFS transporter [Candidatus Dormibacteria bacterium]
MSVSEQEQAAVDARETSVDGGPASAPPPGESRFGLGGSFRSSLLNYAQLRRTPYGLLPALIFSGIAFFSAIQGQVVGFAGPNIAQDLHFTILQLIGIQVAVQLVLVGAGIAFAFYLDRHKRAPWVGIGTLVSSITLLFQSRASGLQSFAVPSVIGSTASAASSVPGYSLLADYYPPEARGRSYALQSTIQRVGLVGATVFGGLLIARYGWRVMNALLAVPIIIISIIAFVVLREPVRGYFERREAGFDEEAARVEDPPQSIEESLRTVLAVRTLRRIIFAEVFSNIGDGAYALFFTLLLADYYGLDAFGRSMVALPALVASLVGGYIGGGAIDALSKRAPSSILRLSALVGLASTAAVVIIAAAPPLWLLVALGVVTGFASAAVAPVRFALTSQVIPPSSRTLGVNLAVDIAQVPGILALTYFGLIQANFGYTATLLATVPFLVIAAVIRLSSADLFDGDRRQAILTTVAAREAMLEKREAARHAAKQGAASNGAPPRPILRCRAVDVGYDGTQVLFGVNFEVYEGEIVALLGTNGAGKSTLLRAVSGSTEASSGSITFLGRDITHMPPYETAAEGVIYMPGGRGTFSALNVRDNLEMGSWMETDRAAAAAKLQRIYEMFPVLKAKGGLPSGALSGGEQQMLSLSQAFLSNPKLLMIDELSLGLSPAVVGDLLKIVKQIRDEGTAVVVVEQSVNVALTIAERAAFMEKGEVKFVGPTADLLQRPDILRAVYVKGTGGALSSGQAAGEAVARRRQQELDGSAPVLQVEGIVKRFGGVTALNDVSLTLRQGEVLGLVGPNGSGKTTLLDVISGEIKPDEGRVHYKGVDITTLAAHQRARQKLVRRFQDANLFPSLTVYETLLVALDQRLEVRNPLFNAVGLPQARRAERRLRIRADRLLELLALQAFRDKFVSELSTGLRRILDLAFVLATEAEVLLLDEPSSGIAQSEAEGLGPLIKRIRFETGCSILIIEHDIPLISAVADELVALNVGEVIVRGTPDEVLNDPRVVESFLGGSEAAIQRSGSLA